jgi:hypothetical protein
LPDREDGYIRAIWVSFKTPEQWLEDSKQNGEAMQSDAALQVQHAAFQTLSVSLFGAVTAKVE